MKTEIFLGLDFSSKCCGYAVLKRDKSPDATFVNVVEIGDFIFDEPPKNLEIVDGYKVRKVFEETTEMLIKFKPDAVLIEEIFAQTVSGYKMLSKVQGAIEAAIYTYNHVMAAVKPVKTIYRSAVQIRACYSLNTHKKSYIDSLSVPAICDVNYTQQVAILEARSK
ncbi:MAG: crossover junction endodeoxyribonuclease RuvC, partial [Clostridia bacterium]|nr:crossover junction endodeoxyribonuclease RuvC [Clostridia bacterium]